MNILTADDDHYFRDMLQQALQKSGHNLFFAENGLEAWQLFKKTDMHIIISDWLMPHMDGLALCKKIRSVPKKITPISLC
jgi:CheY-like chemotaxis protein